MPNPRDCAELLLDTVPPLMRGLMMSVHQKKCHDEDTPNKSQVLGQFRLLEILRHKQPTLSELASLHRVTPSTMSRSVDVLVRRGWVARESDPQDRRQVILQLTNEGTEVHRAMVDRMHESVAEHIAQLDEAEIAQLYSGLEVLQKLMVRIQAQRVDEEQPKGGEE